MKGILFKPEMIKAIKEDRKTQTRRLSGLEEINQKPDIIVLGGWDRGYKAFIFYKVLNGLVTKKFIIKPRYRVGETVYIKEAWATENRYNHLKPSEIPHTAKIFYLSDGYDPFTMGKKRSPMFMMEWMARWFIRILDAGTGRLQEITYDDCKAEGVFVPSYPAVDIISTPRYRQAYLNVWNKINGKTYPWVCNPFVFRYKFEKVLRK